MAYETLVAVYDTPAHADAAVKALKAAGFAESDISVFDAARLKGGKVTMSSGVKETGLWHRLFGTDVYEHEADIYGQTIEDGGVVISVRVPASEVAHASAVLNIHRPVDVHDRAVTAGVAPASRVETIEKKIEAVPLAAVQQVAVSPKLAAAQPDVLRLAEEQLEVGKEMVETGRTRVRRFVTEREVAQDITLHEEHAEVLRNAISDPTYIGEIDWADGTVEIIETAEHALANKTARIVEEVGLRKIGADHVETIKDKLRRQQVEIERVDASGRVIPDTKPKTA
jgi:stress response protein YsnF